MTKLELIKLIKYCRSKGMYFLAFNLDNILNRLYSITRVSTIRKSPNKNEWCVYSKDGSRTFGCYSSKKQAENRLRQIEYFKHRK